MQRTTAVPTSLAWRPAWLAGLQIKQIIVALLGLMVLSSPQAATAQQAGDFGYTTDGATITITNYTGTNLAVVIPGAIQNLPVTDIATAAFAGLPITSVTIPEGVTNIDGYAFDSCNSLGSATIPSTVVSIGGFAFGHCVSLTNAPIPVGVTSIGSFAFWFAPQANVFIPASVTNIGLNVFSQNYNDTAINVDPANQYLSSSNGVLFDKGQTQLIEYPAGGTNSSYEIPGGVTAIAQNAFNSCTNLANVVIGGGVSSIGPFAFLGCQGLTNATIQSGVAAIGGWAFQGCASLQSVAIPDSVSEIGPFAFTSCGSLPGLALPKALTILDDGVFSYCPNLTNITISPLVTSIGAGAFFGCSNLSTIVLPEYVASLGSNAFQNCASLTGVYSFQGNAPSVVDPTVFSNVGPATVYYLPGTSGWGAPFGGLPTAPWTLPYPVELNQSAGAQSNQFSFTVSWATNLSVIVEASTNLANPAWSPLATNALAGGAFQFGDPGWTNYPARFYRVRSR